MALNKKEREKKDTIISKTAGPDSGPTVAKSPEYAPGSPPVIPKSPEYAPNTPTSFLESPESSPEYSPGTVRQSPEYATGSPAIIPQSPEYSKVSPAYVGGSAKHDNDDDDEMDDVYKVNDLVSIRGENGKVWRIKEINHHFITIENMSPTRDEDTIRVVEPSKIYPATHISSMIQSPTMYDTMHKIPMMQDMGTMGTMGAMGAMGPMQGIQGIPGGIQINPTFVVGDNNTVPTTGNANANANANGTDDSANFNKQPVGSIKIGETIGENNIKIKKMDGGDIQTEKEEKKEEVSSNSFFDFLKIKKLG